MSEAAAVETHEHGAMQADQLEPSLTPGNLGKLGMWSFLAGDAMTFGAAIAAYLGITTTAIMTFILICSSVTMVEALGSIQTGRMARYRNFMALTVLGGLVFLGMQAFEWHHLLGEKGMSIKVDLFDATFFILTGFHGCHVFGGVVYNSVLLIRGMTGKLTPAKANLVEIAGLYWHFVDLVWILIFTFIYLI
jgi:cytochrome c oxidase subunit 3